MFVWGLGLFFMRSGVWHCFSTLLSLSNICCFGKNYCIHILANCWFLLLTSLMKLCRFLTCLIQSTMEYSILKNLHVLFPSFIQMPLLMIKSSVGFLFCVNFLTSIYQEKWHSCCLSYMEWSKYFGHGWMPSILYNPLEKGKKKLIVGATDIGIVFLVLAFLITLVLYFKLACDLMFLIICSFIPIIWS